MIVKEFGPGQRFLAEENPEKVSTLLSEWVRESGLAHVGSEGEVGLSTRTI